MPSPIISLAQVFGGFVNQDTLERAAEWMGAIARTDAEFFLRVQECLSQGIERGRNGDESVVVEVQRSGYYASSPLEAADLCRDLLSLFEREAATGEAGTQ